MSANSNTTEKQIKISNLINRLKELINNCSDKIELEKIKKQLETLTSIIDSKTSQLNRQEKIAQSNSSNNSSFFELPNDWSPQNNADNTLNNSSEEIPIEKDRNYSITTLSATSLDKDKNQSDNIGRESNELNQPNQHLEINTSTDTDTDTDTDTSGNISLQNKTLNQNRESPQFFQPSNCSDIDFILGKLQERITDLTKQERTNLFSLLKELKATECDIFKAISIN